MTVRFGRPIDAGALSAMLADRSLSFCMEFLPAGVREGGEWRIGSVASEPGRSMAVHLSGPKAGVWKDWAADIGGDALDLAAHVLFGGDKGQARGSDLSGGAAAARRYAGRHLPRRSRHRPVAARPPAPVATVSSRRSTTPKAAGSGRR